MVKKIPNTKKKYKSQKRNKLCKICNSKKRYSSSSLSRHMNTVHGEGYICGFCQKTYSEKNTHKFCLEKEKYLLGIFIEGYRYNKNISNTPSNFNNIKNLSFIFEDKGNALISTKIKLGMGRFSNVYYGLEKEGIFEIAVKFPKKKEYLLDYLKEAMILKKLEGTKFFPKLINSSEIQNLEKLELTLMGPTLLDLFRFTNGFDRKTIINVLISLVEKLQYLSTNGIIHYDIKPENIVWGVFSQSKINNINDCYFIDYGFGIDLKNEGFGNNKNNKWKKGTSQYMSISAHQNIRPNYVSDLESLLYSALYLAKIYQPWRYIDSISFIKNEKIMESKLNYDVEKYCGNKFDFLSQLFYYFKMVRNEKTTLDYDVVFEILKNAQKDENKYPPFYPEKYIFLNKLKTKLKEFELSGLNFPSDLELIKLFKNYPVNYHKLAEFLNNTNK